MIQKNINNKNLTLILIVLTIGIILSSATYSMGQTEKEISLRKRVDLFYKYFTDGKIDKMSEFFLQKNQENTSNEDKEKFEIYKKFLQQLSLLHPKVCILNVKTDTNKATVTVEISIWNEEKQEWVGETNNNVWVFENSTWFFLSQIEK
jgi:hypothetical protein